LADVDPVRVLPDIECEATTATRATRRRTNSSTTVRASASPWRLARDDVRDGEPAADASRATASEERGRTDARAPTSWRLGGSIAEGDEPRTRENIA
jgi:hypothetical protein